MTEKKNKFSTRTRKWSWLGVAAIVMTSSFSALAQQFATGTDGNCYPADPATLLADTTQPAVDSSNCVARFNWGNDAQGNLSCYPADPNYVVIVGSSPVPSQNCSFNWGKDAQGNLNCYPADNNYNVVIGSNAVTSDSCPTSWFNGADGITPSCFLTNSSAQMVPNLAPLPGNLCQVAANGQLCQPADASGDIIVGMVNVDPSLCPATLEAEITSINGDYNPTHAQELWVHPGDVITLSADLLDQNNGYLAQNADVESFVWTAQNNDANTTEVCDASDNATCVATTNFQTTDYGVTYYVPYTLGQLITVSVKSSNPMSYAANDNYIFLRNANWIPAYQPPVAPVFDLAVYPYDHFNFDLALAGMGRWVWIDGVRYFAPNAYVGDDGEGWRPYRHGYWSWDVLLGWTWISYDPWGQTTDHYGFWRFHKDYGWIWTAVDFDHPQYQPHYATMIDDGVHFGWLPYTERFRDGYAQGFELGFRDGFEDGLNSGNWHIGEVGYTNGFTVINRGDILNVNIYERSKVTIIDRDTVNVFIGHNMTRTVVTNTMTRVTDVSINGRTFIDREQVATVTTRTTIIKDGNTIQIVKGPNVCPPQYLRLHEQITANIGGHVNIRVGAVQQISESHPEKAIVVIAATTNNKGIVPAPAAKNAQGVRVPLAPHSAQPAAPNASNPVMANKKVKPKPATPAPAMPIVKDPTKPPPPPVVAKTNPNRQAPPAPPAAKQLPPPPAPPRPPQRPIAKPPQRPMPVPGNGGAGAPPPKKVGPPAPPVVAPVPGNGGAGAPPPKKVGPPAPPVVAPAPGNGGAGAPPPKKVGPPAPPVVPPVPGNGGAGAPPPKKVGPPAPPVVAPVPGNGGAGAPPPKKVGPPAPPVVAPVPGNGGAGAPPPKKVGPPAPPVVPPAQPVKKVDPPPAARPQPAPAAPRPQAPPPAAPHAPAPPPPAPKHKGGDQGN